MGTIRIEKGDWLKNAGIIGLIKVLEVNTFIDEDKDYIEFDEECLEDFEEDYFRLMIDIHKERLSVSKIIAYDSLLDKIKTSNITKESINEINKAIEYIKKKITSDSYKNGYLIIENDFDILGKAKELSKIKLTKKEEKSDIEEIKRGEVLKQANLLGEIIDFFSDEEVFRIIAAKNVMYDIIQPFWTNASFLLPANPKENMYKLYKKDFINPVLKYNSANKDKYKYNCFICDNKISKLGKPDAYDLTWLVKTGVDYKKKSSHFWNLKCDSYICPICNLVYSCVPLGFNIMYGQGIFINKNSSLKSLKQVNVTRDFYNSDKFEEMENKSYLNIVNYMKNQSVENIKEEFENIQVIKFDSSNSSRPYTFNMLSKEVMWIMYSHRKNLENLIKVTVKVTDKYYINVYNEVVKRLFNGSNMFDLIHQLLVLYLNGSFKGIYSIERILNINNSVLYMKGVKDMNLTESSKYKNYGLKLRDAYKDKSSESKLQGITYRLLNALKTKDTGKFMDTLINSYMYVRKEIPTDFIKALGYNDRLSNVGYAFIIGLQGVEGKNEGGENNDGK